MATVRRGSISGRQKSSLSTADVCIKRVCVRARIDRSIEAFMTRYDVKHSPQRVGDEQAAPRQAAPPPLRTPEEPPSAPLTPRRQRPKPTPNPDADHVLQLCREGRLFELQQWIAAAADCHAQRLQEVPARHRRADRLSQPD
jgi:hypothetical protein